MAGTALLGLGGRGELSQDCRRNPPGVQTRAGFLPLTWGQSLSSTCPQPQWVFICALGVARSAALFPEDHGSCSVVERDPGKALFSTRSGRPSSAPAAVREDAPSGLPPSPRSASGQPRGGTWRRAHRWVQMPLVSVTSGGFILLCHPTLHLRRSLKLVAGFLSPLLPLGAPASFHAPTLVSKAHISSVRLQSGCWLT